MSTASDIVECEQEILKERSKPKFVNRRVVRRFLLDQYGQWGHEKKRKNVSSAVLEEIIDHLEAGVERFIIAQASQDFAGRIGGARVCARERNGGTP